MGRSIVYCDKCGQLLKEEDFRQGRAFTQDNRSYCAGCRPAGSSQIPAPPPSAKASSGRIPLQPVKESISTSRIPKQPANESRRFMAAAPPPSAPPAEGSSSRTLYIVGAVGAVAVIALLAVVAGGGSEKPRIQENDPPPAIVTVKPPPVENLSPENRRREEAARDACVKAYEIQTTRPKDLPGQWRAFEAALAAAQGTSYQPDAESQFGKLKRRLEDERGLLETKTQELLTKEHFKEAMEVWETGVRQYDLPEWTRPVNQRITDLRGDFERRIGVMRETAAEAKRRGDDAEVKRIRARVTAWGIPGFPEQIDAAVADVIAIKKDPVADTSGTAKAIDAYRDRWKEILGPASARDYAEAVKLMEKLAAETKDEAAKKEAAEDLENLRLAAGLVQEGAPLVAKLPKGQKIALTYWDAGGTPAKLEDVLLKIDATRIEIKFGDASMVIPQGEIAATTLADLFKGRAAKKDSDNRAAVVACLLDGDAEGAQRFRGEGIPSINEKYAEAAKEALRRRSADDREKAARRLFTDAEAEYFDYNQMSGAILKYKALLAEQGATAFVRRNRAAIAARAEGGLKDFLFQHGDLNVAGSFKLGKYGRIEGAWASQQDLEAVKMKDNYVQFDFSASVEAEYRVWILAGGCCQEVFTCAYQGTELQGADAANPKEKVAIDPGSAAWSMVKGVPSSLKKLHSQHNGPKNPERFEWIQVGAFKFPTAGSKVIRILTNQKGFAVASAAVLSSRTGAPRDLDFKELEKWRAETPGASLKQGGVVTGSILREVFAGIGGANLGDLYNNPAFKEDRPTERVLINVFEGPTDWADNYGTRIRGYVHPPVSGPYTFWLATDDQGELWLSTDEDPAHKEKIASVPDFTSSREYTKHASQQSKAIELKAGRRYYIEALQKEGGGGDNISVKWKLPNGAEEVPIPGHRLSPWVPVKK